MNMRNLLMSTLVCLTTTLTTLAEFAPPTEAQIQAAAGNPGQLAALLSGASLEQAADVVKTVIDRALALGLPSSGLDARMAQIIGAALGALPAGGHVTFAGLLGSAMGSSLALQQQPGAVSAIQGALVAGGGSSGAAMGLAFGKSFDVAAGGSDNAQNTKDSDKVQPPAAVKYPGQN
jgi:hypothetical protein